MKSDIHLVIENYWLSAIDKTWYSLILSVFSIEIVIGVDSLYLRMSSLYEALEEKEVLQQARACIVQYERKPLKNSS